MRIKRLFVAGILFFVLFGCAPKNMLLKNTDPGSVKPMGLFVCTSAGIIDDKDVLHRKFVIDIASDTLHELLAPKYDLKLLNEKIPYGKAFRTYFASFLIDEKLIAKVADAEGCKSVLIVHYAFNSYNFIPLGIMTVMLEDIKKDQEGLRLHSRCELRGWLVSSQTGKIVSKSLSIDNPFSAYVQENADVEQLGSDYRRYLREITKDMFSTLTQ